jgi:hypothetical protein
MLQTPVLRFSSHLHRMSGFDEAEALFFDVIATRAIGVDKKQEVPARGLVR